MRNLSTILAVIALLAPLSAMGAKPTTFSAGLGYAQGTSDTSAGEVDDTKAFLEFQYAKGARFAYGATLRLGPAFGDGAINDVFVDVRGRAGLRTAPGGLFGYGLFSARMTHWDFPLLFGGGISFPVSGDGRHLQFRLFAEYVASQGGSDSTTVTKDLGLQSYEEWSAGLRWTFY